MLVRQPRMVEGGSLANEVGQQPAEACLLSRLPDPPRGVAAGLPLDLAQVPRREFGGLRREAHRPPPRRGEDEGLPPCRYRLDRHVYRGAVGRPHRLYLSLKVAE